MTVPQKEQIKLLRGQGLSCTEIADRLGISKNTVKTFCRRYGIETSTATKNANHNDPHDHNGLCAHCGKPIHRTRSTKKFCSSACRLAFHKANRPPATACAYCGQTFNNNGNYKRKYCSRKCHTASRFTVNSAGEGVAV